MIGETISITSIEAGRGGEGRERWGGAFNSLTTVSKLDRLAPPNPTSVLKLVPAERILKQFFLSSRSMSYAREGNKGREAIKHAPYLARLLRGPGVVA